MVGILVLYWIHLIVCQMEFAKSKCLCPSNGDQNCTQNPASGPGGVRGVGHLQRYSQSRRHLEEQGFQV